MVVRYNRHAVARALGTALGLALGTVLVVVGGLLAVDQYLHAKHDAYETPNRFGYRGAALGQKAPGEVRVALIGESSAYGYQLINEYSLAVQLTDKLEQALSPRPVSVANLAALGDSSQCYAPTLAHYNWLDPDVVLIDAGYNDNPKTLDRAVSTCYRQRNQIFNLTGYWPVLDLYVREKVYALAFGSVERGYEAAGQIAPTDADAEASADGPGTGVEQQSIAEFCANIDALVEQQLSLGRRVMYVTQPYLNTFHRRQQSALRESLARFAGDPRFAYVDLGNALDLSDPALSFDHMHPTAHGNEVLSERLVGPVAELIDRST
jgi:lysophospholipase L1-like esterase